VVLGFAVTAGWAATVMLVDPFDTPTRPQSLTFVAPVGRALFGLLLNTADHVDFGVATVGGTILGAGLQAWRAGEFRWEAFDDQREMRRHLLGAALMGFGGVCAGGCTFGQGLTAASLLAISAPLAVASMVLGARLGIGLLIGGASDQPWRGLRLKARR
jgi:uncharacterized protein